MKKVKRLILQILSVMSVLLFCVRATAGIGEIPEIFSRSFSEPINMLLIGFALIGFGSFVKGKSTRG